MSFHENGSFLLFCSYINWTGPTAQFGMNSHQKVKTFCQDSIQSALFWLRSFTESGKRISLIACQTCVSFASLSSKAVVVVSLQQIYTACSESFTLQCSSVTLVRRTQCTWELFSKATRVSKHVRMLPMFQFSATKRKKFSVQKQKIFKLRKWNLSS